MKTKQDRPETNRKPDPDVAAPRKRFGIVKLEERIKPRMGGNPMKRSRLFRWAAVPVMAVLLAVAARADEVTDWHEHMLTTLVTAGTNPVVCGRDAALVSAAVFDAVNGIERRYAPIHVPAEAPRGASKRAAAVEAAYVILVSRYPAQVLDLDAKRFASLAAIGESGQSLERGVAWGQEVAQAILDWRSTDGFTSTPPPFLGGNDVGEWRPTPPGFAPGLLPQFATMTPWGIDSPDQFRPDGPLALDSDQYAQEFNEVKAMGSVDSTIRSDDQTDSCKFWQASSPTYLWNRVALDLVAQGDNDLSDNAHLLATMNLATADSQIACWDSKYFYVFWRPVTAIRLADTDGNDGTDVDTSWTPLLVTPPFPEYTSGHSCASSGAATVLAAYFGDATSFAVKSQTDLNWTRSFSSFSGAVAEVADARVFAGIHFRAACAVGVEMGRGVAEYDMENLMKRLHGNGD